MDNFFFKKKNVEPATHSVIILLNLGTATDTEIVTVRNFYKHVTNFIGK